MASLRVQGITTDVDYVCDSIENEKGFEKNLTDLGIQVTTGTSPELETSLTLVIGIVYILTDLNHNLADNQK